MDNEKEFIWIYIDKYSLSIWIDIKLRHEYLWCDEEWMDWYWKKVLSYININIPFITIQFDFYYYWRCDKKDRKLYHIYN